VSARRRGSTLLLRPLVTTQEMSHFPKQSFVGGRGPKPRREGRRFSTRRTLVTGEVPAVLGRYMRGTIARNMAIIRESTIRIRR
jgi:hypothetical protein